MDTSARSQFKSDDGVLHEQERERWSSGGSMGRLSSPCWGWRIRQSLTRTCRCGYSVTRAPATKSQLLDGREAFLSGHHTGSVLRKAALGEGQAFTKSLRCRRRLRPYVNDFSINVFEISYLSEEQLAMFGAISGVVAEYFVRSRTDPEYKPQAKGYQICGCLSEDDEGGNRRSSV